MRRGFHRTPRAVLVLLLLAVFTPIVGAHGIDQAVAITTRLEPHELVVAPGTTVTWTNNHGEEHRMRSQSGPEEFDSGNLATGESFSFNFALEGTYTYIDERNDDNANYYGTVIVAADATPPDPGNPPPPPTSGDVSIIDRSYQPASLIVAEGASVTWANNDGEEHTVTATDSSWDSGIFDTGQTYTRTFGTAATYNYFCLIHPEMTGVITVTGAGGEPPPPEPDPPPPPPDPEPPPPPAAGDVNIVDFAFDPVTLNVTEGASVAWSNTGAAPHTVTSTAGTFDSGVLFSGATYQRTFAAAGTYNYFCTLHPEMNATVVVSGSEGTPPPPPPDPDPPPPPPDPDPPPPTVGDVNIVDFAFDPTTLTVGVGATVTWSNTGAAPHTVTATNGVYDSVLLLTGETYARTFLAAGTYNYLCTLHPQMTATVVVTGSGGAPPPPPDPEPPPPGDPGAPPAPPPGGIAIIDNAFSPSSRTITTGTRLVWTNTGALPHTVTSAAGGFDSGVVLTGASYGHTFTQPGSFGYICTIHPEMTGTINVSGEPIGEPADGEGSTGARDQLRPYEDAPPSSPSLAGSAGVAIIDNDYEPGVLTVAAGSTIRFTNTGELPHTVTAHNESFDSGFILTGDTFDLALPSPGSYEFFCTIHPEMVGTITVVDGPTGAEPENPSEAPAATAETEASSTTPPPTDVAAGTGLVLATMVDNAFRPRTLRIDLGQTVQWRNDGALPHTITASDGTYDSDLVLPGGVFEHTYTETGRYSYVCAIHPEMTASVEVVAPESEALSALVATPPVGPLSDTAAFVMAGSIIAAVAVFALGMVRFGQAAARER